MCRCIQDTKYTFTGTWLHAIQAYADKVGLELLETTDPALTVIPGETKYQEMLENVQISVSKSLSSLNILLQIMKEIFNNIYRG